MITLLVTHKVSASTPQRGPHVMHSAAIVMAIIGCDSESLRRWFQIWGHIISSTCVKCPTIPRNVSSLSVQVKVPVKFEFWLVCSDLSFDSVVWCSRGLPQEANVRFNADSEIQFLQPTVFAFHRYLLWPSEKVALMSRWSLVMMEKSVRQVNLMLDIMTAHWRLKSIRKHRRNTQ